MLRTDDHLPTHNRSPMEEINLQSENALCLAFKARVADQMGMKNLAIQLRQEHDEIYENIRLNYDDEK